MGETEWGDWHLFREWDKKIGRIKGSKIEES